MIPKVAVKGTAAEVFTTAAIEELTPTVN